MVRNERYRKNAISVRERRNERKNEVYSNPDVLLEHSHNNVIFKACDAPTYAQKFDQMVADGIVSTRGLKPDAYVFDELVFDVNTDYFETHGGYEYAKRFYREAMRTAPQQVQTFLLGIQRHQQAEQQLHRAQRRQRARGQER